MEKYDVGLILNLTLIILEIIGLVLCYDALGCIDLAYYTIDSNIFLLLSSILYVFSRKNPSKSVQFFRYSATLSVLITLLVVVFVLYPMLDFNFEYLFLAGPNPYMHVLCPIIALVSFLFFEKNEVENTLKNNIRSLYFTLIYAVILITLNILRVVNGPYPFLKVYEQSVLMSVIWIVAILGFVLILSNILLTVKELDMILNV
ncbi:Pr6Pr family membrane protein [Methanobrevibacter sp.]|uniref:Pr6Pr family membrane protein n=1 Tax=Methanobrevibacter sp. TaxID=66852 RepID=UPI00388FC7FA